MISSRDRTRLYAARRTYRGIKDTMREKERVRAESVDSAVPFFTFVSDGSLQPAESCDSIKRPITWQT